MHRFNIQDYSFGKMVINGESFDRDLIITPQEIIPNWWRNKGHELQIEDIRETLEHAKPEVLVVGKGQYGRMSINKEVKDYLLKNGIALEQKKTGKAIQVFNNICHEGKRAVGAFHLTC
jgi:hypothetical protein